MPILLFNEKHLLNMFMLEETIENNKLSVYIINII